MQRNLTSRLLLIRPEFAERAAILAGIADGTITLDMVPEAARFGVMRPESQPQMTVENGVARIPVLGVLYRGAKFEGTTDLNTIAANVREADRRPDVKSILLAVDSPGGTVQGTPEAADAVGSAEKPILAFVHGQAASAAYWIASSADQVYASPSAEVGSIGCYMAFFDVSGMFAQMGVKTEVITSGKYKGAGMMGTSLSPDQRANLQQHVDALAEDFKMAVRTNRFPRSIDAEVMQGQVFQAKTASAHGLIDGIMRSEEAVLRMLG